MGERYAIRIEARRDRLPELARFVDERLRDLGVDENRAGKLFLAIDELATNIVSYAYPGQAGELELVFETFDEGLRATLIDEGRPFDPTQHPTPNTQLSVEERPIGGLGIHLARNMVDAMRYRREGKTNRTELTLHMENH